MENETSKFDIPAARVAIALNAVLVGLENGHPKILCLKRPDDTHALPYGPFDPDRHRTMEMGIREWVTKQTNVSLGFVEQLYTFGDKGREAPMAALEGEQHGDRIVSVGYLALTPVPAAIDHEGTSDAQWVDWYAFFPWEDWRQGQPASLDRQIFPHLQKWAAEATTLEKVNRRQARIALAFGRDQYGWEEERTLDRYELMFEAGLVEEARRHNVSRKNSITLGRAMHSDHRRILATAIGRLRGKLKYRPIIFEMVSPQFTLLQLQQTAEAIVGFTLHKQNFRRSVEKSGFVKATTKTIHQTSGRPAALFVTSREGLRAGVATGLTIPRLKL